MNHEKTKWDSEGRRICNSSQCGDNPNKRNLATHALLWTDPGWQYVCLDCARNICAMGDVMGFGAPRASLRKMTPVEQSLVAMAAIVGAQMARLLAGVLKDSFMPLEPEYGGDGAVVVLESARSGFTLRLPITDDTLTQPAQALFKQVAELLKPYLVSALARQADIAESQPTPVLLVPVPRPEGT